jgi:hypothetical protein
MSGLPRKNLRYVILRDDDTNALTPVECLERLYRPFLQRGLPVNLATIPEVRLDACTPDGAREGFLPRSSQEAEDGGEGNAGNTVPLAANRRLLDYLHTNPGYRIVQHGCHHETFEFDCRERAEVVRRLERGARGLRDAGFDDVRTFVAPHDRLSRVAYEEAAKRFAVISTGWFTWRRLPAAWRLRYLLKKMSGRAHWRVNGTLLLSHPGCLLSYQKSYDTMVDAIRRAIERQEVTVLVTHWWEYFRGGTPDTAFIGVLHRLADYLATRPDICVTTFDALADGAGENGVPGAGGSGRPRRGWTSRHPERQKPIVLPLAR